MLFLFISKLSIDIFKVDLKLLYSEKILSIIFNQCQHIKAAALTELLHPANPHPIKEIWKEKSMTSSVNPKPSSDGLKSKVDKTSSLKVAQTSPFLAASKEPSSNSRMSSFQAAIKSLLPEIEDNSWIEDCSFSNIKLKDFLKEESTFQSKTKKVDLELWIILEFSIKKKTKSSN